MGSKQYFKITRRLKSPFLASPHLQELESRFYANGGWFKKFALESLFDCEYGNFDIQKKHINDKGEVVISAGETNTGVIGRSDVNAKIFEANTLTMDMFGYVFYRNYKYKMVTHARVFSLKFKDSISPNCMLYVVSAMSYFKYKFDFSNMATWNKVKNEIIYLPVHKNGEIAFDFMESYIKELEIERVREVEFEQKIELKAYLQATNLKDYTLTESEINAINIFNALDSKTNGGGGGGKSRLSPSLQDKERAIQSPSLRGVENTEAILSLSLRGEAKGIQAKNKIIDYHDLLRKSRNDNSTLKWQEFKIADLFEIYTGRDVIISRVKSGKIPLISHQNTNNGVVKHIEKLDNRILFDYKKTISLADRGVFCAFTQNQNFHIGTRVKALVFKQGYVSVCTRLFFTTAINQLQALFAEYLTNATDKLPYLTIALPVDKNGRIAFDFIESFIKAIQKEVIKNIVLYNDKKLNAYHHALT